MSRNLRDQFTKKAKVRLSILESLFTIVHSLRIKHAGLPSCIEQHSF